MPAFPEVSLGESSNRSLCDANLADGTGTTMGKMMDRSKRPLDQISHEPQMRRAIELAVSARAKGNKPFGALLADFDGNVLLEAENTEFSENDFSCHAETNLLSMASRKYSVEQLNDMILYASCEPCAMCAGAAFFVGVGHVVFGLSADALAELWENNNPNPRVLDMSCRQVFDTALNHPVQVVGPIMQQEASAPHVGYKIPWK
ncbi:nucleoside deaminase [Ruegeria atlantica]|uniref:nucleoside deaminase n=1 Tax=Ruegeria atlantica TaxID=81569 RepID=UPI001479B311|nr:nucleoside deaminase [Ruegeria atlantica]